MKTKPTLTKYKLETQLIDELNERKPEMNGKEYFQDVINEIVGNNVPIYNSDLLDLVSEDLNFGFQGEFKISCDDGNLDIILQSNSSLELIICAKYISYWTINCLPLI